MNTNDMDGLRKLNAELLAALDRMVVGVTGQSSPTCEWYEGITDDTIAEARAVILMARRES